MHLWCHCFGRFSWPAPLLGKHIITEFIHDLFVSIKAAMDLLSIAILLQLWCVYFCCPVNRAQARAEFMGLAWAERERHNILIFTVLMHCCILRPTPKQSALRALQILIPLMGIFHSAVFI